MLPAHTFITHTYRTEQLTKETQTHTHTFAHVLKHTHIHTSLSLRCTSCLQLRPLLAVPHWVSPVDPLIHPTLPPPPLLLSLFPHSLTTIYKVKHSEWRPEKQHQHLAVNLSGAIQWKNPAMTSSLWAACATARNPPHSPNQPPPPFSGFYLQVLKITIQLTTQWPTIRPACIVLFHRVLCCVLGDTDLPSCGVKGRSCLCINIETPTRSCS